VPRSLTVLIEPVGVSNNDNRAINSDHDVVGVECMSNAQGNILLTAHIACGTFTSALGAITDVGDWSVCTAADRDLGRCVAVIWDLKSGDVHILQWRIDAAPVDIYKEISNIEGFVGSAHIARLRREAPGRRLSVCGTSGRKLVFGSPRLTPQVSRCALGRR